MSIHGPSQIDNFDKHTERPPCSAIFNYEINNVIGDDVSTTIGKFRSPELLHSMLSNADLVVVHMFQNSLNLIRCQLN